VGGGLLTVHCGDQQESAWRPSRGAAARRGLQSGPRREKGVPDFWTSERSSCLWLPTRFSRVGGRSYFWRRHTTRVCRARVVAGRARDDDRIQLSTKLLQQIIPILPNSYFSFRLMEKLGEVLTGPGNGLL